jgi:hypothetical protein
MYAMASRSENPVVKSVKQPITISTNGNFQVGVCPLISSTTVRGISPMKKLIALEIVDERAKISGMT